MSDSLKSKLFFILLLITIINSYPQNKIKILFIGNSYCDFYVIPSQVSKMMSHKGIDNKILRQTKGGYTLKKHWNEGVAQKRLKKERYKIAVIQGQSKSPLIRKESFYDYGTRFINYCQKKRIYPVLYLTWARSHRLYDQEEITYTYSKLAVEQEVPVAPVGEAFKRFKNKFPDFELHRSDKSHPNVYGSYLSACVLYATLTGKSPVGQISKIKGYNWLTKGEYLTMIDNETAEEIQKIAWQTYKHFDPKVFIQNYKTNKL